MRLTRTFLVILAAAAIFTPSAAALTPPAARCGQQPDRISAQQVASSGARA